MKLILSRKGFDSVLGMVPSPILPDGRLVPLPITSRRDRYTLRDIHMPGIDLEPLLTGISGGNHSMDTKIHLDPDLDRAPETRLPGWRPALGQTLTAQSHLQNKNVNAGDVFLFFGWFREAVSTERGWRYVTSAPDLHVIFGWLEVGDVLPVVVERERCLSQYPWIANHPHVRDPRSYWDKRNTLYIGSERSRFRSGCTGGGRFRAFSERLRLTKRDRSRGVWTLPGWFMPEEGRTPLSYHGNLARWEREGENAVTLRTVGRGQEFVLDLDEYPEAHKWISNIIGNA